MTAAFPAEAGDQFGDQAPATYCLGRYARAVLDIVVRLLLNGQPDCVYNAVRAARMRAARVQFTANKVMNL